MNKAFDNLKKTSEFKKGILGYFRITNFINESLEECEPNFDCFLIVGIRFFKGKEYISRAKWQELWEQAIKKEGKELKNKINTKRINAKNEYSDIDNAIYQIRKNILNTNSQALNLSNDNFSIFYKQIKGIRQFSKGGLFKNLTKKKKEKYREINSIEYKWNNDKSKYEKVN